MPAEKKSPNSWFFLLSVRYLLISLCCKYGAPMYAASQQLHVLDDNPVEFVPVAVENIGSLAELKVGISIGGHLLLRSANPRGETPVCGCLCLNLEVLPLCAAGGPSEQVPPVGGTARLGSLFDPAGHMVRILASAFLYGLLCLVFVSAVN